MPRASVSAYGAFVVEYTRRDDGKLGVEVVEGSFQALSHVFSTEVPKPGPDVMLALYKALHKMMQATDHDDVQVETKEPQTVN